MDRSFLKLNDSKTELLVVSSVANSSAVQEGILVKIGDEVIHPVAAARNIGAFLDSHLSMSAHIDAICRSCYMCLRHISQIRPFLSEETAERIIHAYISSKLDNFNSLLYGLPNTCLHKLQLIQNTAARIIKLAKKSDHITPLLYSLHWLPVKERIEYKILLLTFKSLNNLAPAYISELLQPYQPSRSLRSSGQFLLQQPKSRTKRYGDRAFSTCAPQLWNSLPVDVRQITSLSQFKKAIKTILFKRAYKGLQ